MTERQKIIASDAMHTLREVGVTASTDDPAAMEALVAAANADAAHDFEAELARLAEAFALELSAKGWPPFAASIEVHGDQWRPVEATEAALIARWAAGERFTLTRGSAFIKRRVEALSDDWFRWKLSALIERLTTERSPKRKMITAYEIGHTQETWRSRRAFRKGFEAGRKSIEGGKRGTAERKAATAADETRRLDRMAALLERNPNVKRAADIAHRERLGKSAEANRRLWYRRRPK